MKTHLQSLNEPFNTLFDNIFLKHGHKSNIIAGYFTWDRTIEGHFIWQRLSLKWNKILDTLNKEYKK